MFPKNREGRERARARERKREREEWKGNTQDIWMCLRTTREGKLVHFRINPDKLQICNYMGFRACLLTIHSGILWLLVYRDYSPWWSWCLIYILCLIAYSHGVREWARERERETESPLLFGKPRRKEWEEWLKVHKKKGGKTRTLIKYLQHVLKLSSRLVFIVLRFHVSVCSQFVVFQ